MPENADIAAMEERLRRAFQHVLWLGSRDLDSSKWYAEELAKIAAQELRDTYRIPPAQEDQ